MYKKLILASAIAGLAAGSNAGTFETVGFTMPIHGKEGLKNVTDADGAGIGSALFKLGAEYAANDTITFSLNNAKATNSNWPTSLTSVKPGTATTTTMKAACAAAATVCSFTTNANMVDGDQFTIAGDTTIYRIKSKAASATMTLTPAIVKAVTTGDVITMENPKTVSLGLVNSTDNAATYRVLSTGGAGTPTSSVGTLVPTPLVEVNKSQAVAANTVMSASSATGTGIAMDTTAGTMTVMSTVAQFTDTVTVATKFNAVVDVEASSKAFVGSTTTNGADSMKLDYTAATTQAGAGAVVSAAGVLTSNNATATVTATNQSAVYTITGDFTFMDDDTATAGCQSAAGLTDSSGTSTPTLATTCDKITLTDTTIADNTVTITKNQAAAVIPVQSYAGSAVMTYTSAATKATDSVTYADMGSWTLNGASITVYGVPMGSTVDRMIWVNNSGTTDVAVTASVMSGGTTTSNLALGTAAAGSNTSVDEALDTALTAAGVTLPSNSRANVTLSAPAKAADITVSAAYKVIADADRLSLETTDTVDGTTK